MIELPWPDRCLSPNARPHWATKAKAAKVARKYGHCVTLAAGLNANTFKGYGGKLHLWIDCYAKTRNYPDADNLLASLKSAIDGIADALGVNDKRFVPHPFVKTETFKGGRVVIRITTGADGCDAHRQ